MPLREIRIWPDPALKEIAKPVAADSLGQGRDNDEINDLIQDLFDTMYDSNGIGLAANQVAVLKRVIVLDLDPHQDAEEEPEIAEELASWGYEGPLAFINPEIIKSEGSIVWEEGCLSVPGITEKVKRSEHVIVRALDSDGEVFETEAHGLYAVALQHEIDHLDGRVFVEYISKLKRDVVRRKMERLKQELEEEGEDAGDDIAS